MAGKDSKRRYINYRVSKPRLKRRCVSALGVALARRWQRHPQLRKLLPGSAARCDKVDRRGFMTCMSRSGAQVDAYLTTKLISRGKQQKPRECCGSSEAWLRFFNHIKFCVVCCASLTQATVSKD